MLNFKDWKLESQDGKVAKLKHASGHQMTIAMKSLPRIQREQIMRLAKAEEFKDGGKVEKFSDDDNEVGADDSSTSNKQSPQGTTNIFQIGTQGPATPAQQPIPAAVNPAAAYQQALTSAPAPQVPGANGVPNVPQTGSVLNPNGQPNPAAANQAAQAANTGQQMINAATAKALVPENQAYLKAQGDLLKNPTAVYNALQSETDRLNADTNGEKIDTRAWLNNPGVFGQQGELKKSLAGIGLVLGGIGAGKLGSTNNPALAALNSQIDREIDAQQKSFNNKNTVLGQYQNLFGNSIVATNLAKNALAEAHKSYIDLVANQMGTPQSRVNAEKLKADISAQQQLRNKESAFDVTEAPGYKPAYEDTSAQNVSRETSRPSMARQSGDGLTTEDLNALHSQQVSQAGLPASSEGTSEENSPLDSLGDNNQLLDANAAAKLERLRQQNVYKTSPQGLDYNDVKSQYDQAFNADQQLGQVNSLYKRLYGETNGLSGRIHRGINPHGVAAAGTALGTGLGFLGAGVPGAIGGASIGAGLGEGIGHGIQGLTNTGTNQEYDADLESLKGIISASLKNRGDMTVEEAVQKFAPTSQDTEKEALKKRELFKKFIIDHVDKGMLSVHGLTAKK